MVRRGGAGHAWLAVAALWAASGCHHLRPGGAEGWQAASRPAGPQAASWPYGAAPWPGSTAPYYGPPPGAGAPYYGSYYGPPPGAATPSYGPPGGEGASPTGPPAAPMALPAPSPGTADAYAARAVAFARAQQGKPYCYGGTGPQCFDCSGLIYAAWRWAGHPVPRTSTDQHDELTGVAWTDVRPGDVVWRPGHVGLYVGDGWVIHAPETGKRVSYEPAQRYARALRP